MGLVGSFWGHALLLAVLAFLGARGHLLRASAPASSFEAAVALPPAPASDPIPIDVRSLELAAAPAASEDGLSPGASARGVLSGWAARGARVGTRVAI